MRYPILLIVFALIFPQAVVALAPCPRAYCIYIPNVSVGETSASPTATATTTATATATTTATTTATAPATATATTTATTPTTTPPTGNNPAWTPTNSRPCSTTESQSVVVGGKWYVFGGFNTSAGYAPRPCAYVYDPATGRWTKLADMPRMNNGTVPGGLTHSGFTTDGTDIYFASGYTAQADGTGQIFGTKEAWKYTVATNSYSRLPDLPVARAAGQLAYLNGKLHYVGGTNQARTQDVGDQYVLDLSNLGAGWVTKKPLPNPRHHGGMAVLNGQIYYIGGQWKHDGALVPQSDVHRYDPATDSWTQVASLKKPTNHAGASTVVFNGKIIVIGGQMNHQQSIDDVVQYDPATDSWADLSPLPRSVHSGVGAALNGKLYFATGSTNSQIGSQMWIGTFPAAGATAAPQPRLVDLLLTALTPLYRIW